jgi:hypothetical protein
MWFTPVWGYVHQPLRLFIICLNLTFIHSCALSHRVELHTRQGICALSTRFSFQNQVRAQRQPSNKNKALTNIHSLSQSYSNYLQLALKNSISTIHSSLFILLQTLTIRHQHGKPHGLASHKPITKTLENPLLGPHSPQKRVTSYVSCGTRGWDTYTIGNC